MGWSFEEQISSQIVDVTKPWRATLGYEHRFKGFFHENKEFITYIQILEKCFEFKMMLDYLVPGLFSTNALNSKCWKIS